MTSVILCRAASYRIRRIASCPVCLTRRRILAQDEAWYGMRLTCCHCGTMWQDGEPFRQNAEEREETARRARILWKEAGPYDKAAHRRWVHEETGVQE